MKMYGSFTEQVDSKFRASDNSEVTLAPFATPGADITFTLPGISISDNLVSDTSSSTLTNKTLTLPQIASLSPDGVETLTFPVATDTLVGKNTTDILTNKTLGISNTVTLLDTLFTLEDNSTNNQLDFELSLLTANRTLSSPDASGILTLTDASQTLTNKSIDADSNTITNIDNNEIKAAAAIALDKLAALNTSIVPVTDGSGFLISSAVTSTELGYVSGVTSAIQTQIDSKQADVITTRGDLVYGNASNVADRLPIGTVGQVLTSDGTDVSWSSPAGTGDVTSTANITDNSLVRGDGGAKGIQQSGITIDDNDNASGFNSVILDSQNTGDITIASGSSMMHSFMEIATGTTITVNGSLGVIDSITVNGTGTLTINGNAKIA